MPGDDLIKDAAGKAAKEAKELAKDGAAIGRLVGSGGTDLSSWWRLIKRWGSRFLKIGVGLAIVFIQLIAASSMSSAECGGGAADPANGPAYATTGGGSQPDMAIVKLVYDAVKTIYGNNPDGNRILLATFETALTESNFQNLKGGDRDSAGVFQQRPSQGWGSYQDVTNPTYATKKFLSRIDTAHKQYPNVPAYELAQHVQGSACDGSGMPSWCNGMYGGNYQQKEAQAKDLIGKVGGMFASTGTTGTMNSTPGSTNVVPATTNACDSSFGSTVAIGQKGVHIKSKGVDYVIDIPVGQRGKVIQAALTQLGVTYVYGGDSWGHALDCSALTSQSLKRGAGITVPRTAADQYAAAKTKGPLSNPAIVKPGDLIFYDEGSGSIGHVTIYLGMGTMNGGKPIPLMVAAPHTGDVVKVQPVYDGKRYWGDPGYTDNATSTV